MTVLVLDCDGVVVLGHADGGRWDRHLARDLGIAPEKLQEHFFRRHWPSIATGGNDLMDVLQSVWPQISASTSPQAFVDYWFAADSRLDVELLAEVDAWRAGGNRAFLATVQEHHRARYLWQTLGLSRRFDGMHYSAELGAAKPDLKFYERSHARLPVSMPREVLFFDDAVRNVDAARAFGWRAQHYREIGDLRAALADVRSSDVTRD